VYTLLSVCHICGVPRRRLLEYTADAIVETDSVSVNADYDNGITLQRHACSGLSKNVGDRIFHALG
jgi:hypothetical protein